MALRLTQTASGGGCACKIPPGELRELLAGVDLPGSDALLVGAETGDDAAVVRLDGGRALVSTVDFFTPVVDDPFDWGRIAATNALSDVWAMGGEALLAVNLVTWPRATLPTELLAEALRGGAMACADVGVALAGGHSIDGPEPVYGLAATGLADPARLLRNDAARPGDALSLTKPLGLGVLNNRHKATGEAFPEAVAVMTTPNRDASRAALAAGLRAATDVTGFGLLGHLATMMRASGTTAVLDVDAVPVLAAAVTSLADGYVPGGSRRNLDWVRPDLDPGAAGEDALLLLADAQTSGGLLLSGEVPGATTVGEVVPRRDDGSLVVLRGRSSRSV
ncbi:selenide, water dikinase SelD [Phycicoccus sonneratiae]|uniref:Selenide, water dikinase n=1 Tax=Phycicoccus sonneratiae TaxID=2807628 RepID=A0ABS2CRU9_9MICO|nr:selenide, water dikinase SelD [Phycicoccus sonneraticus]MBM6402588.1 selenide, water dikinase SelD [Phycicoccus sonneraticus]